MHWHLLTHKTPSDLPKNGQDIFCCISEGEGTPFTAVHRMHADLSAIQDLLLLYPNWQIYWHPVPEPSPPSPPEHH